MFFDVDPKVNIHQYDGQIDTSELRNELTRVRQIPYEQKMEILTSFLEVLQDDSCKSIYKNRRSFNPLMNIIRDSREGVHPQGPNYDPTNNLYAEDLVVMLAQKILHPCVDKTDFIDVLFLQFNEMTTGLCPQGRATRMYQINLAFPNLEPGFEWPVSSEEE